MQETPVLSPAPGMSRAKLRADGSVNLGARKGNQCFVAFILGESEDL